MKNTSILILMICLSLKTIGQEDKESYSIEPKILYKGIDNTVTVAAKGVASSDIVISAMGCGTSFSCTKIGMVYNFRFTGTGECLIALSKRGKNGIKPMGKPVSILVKPLPDPTIKLSKKVNPSELTISELKSLDSIVLNLNLTNSLEIPCEVISVEINGIDSNNSPYTYFQPKSLFSEDSKKKLISSKVGTKISLGIIYLISEYNREKVTYEIKVI